jgi:hypothetical protein
MVIVTIVPVRWYSDTVIDAVAHIAARSPRAATTFYQDAVSITAHLTVIRDMEVYAQKRNRENLKEWCVRLRALRNTAPGPRWPCSLMRDQLSIVFAWNPFGSHWVTVEITKGGMITLWDSFKSLGGIMPRYAQRVLPLYAQLIALNPNNDWDDSAFLHCGVVFPETPQQGNGDDCGPATATTLYHLLRKQPLETTVDGQCLRFAHLVMIYNTLYGPCPFTLHDDDNTPYVLPDQHSLIDLGIFRLLNGTGAVLPPPEQPPPYRSLPTVSRNPSVADIWSLESPRPRTACGRSRHGLW